MARPVWSLSRRTVRALFSRLQAISPTLAAQLAAAKMFRTSRRKPDAFETEVRARGQALSVDGPSGRLALRRWGEGPLIFLLHGWNGRGTQLGGFVDPLLQAGYQVVALDAPGHGESAGSTSSLVGFADAFDAALLAVKPPRGSLAGVIAHSMGGPAVTFALSRAQRLPVEPKAPDTGGPRLVFIAPPTDVQDFVVSVSGELGLSAPTQRALQSALERRVGQRLEDLHAVRLARGMTAPLLVVHDEQDRAVPVERGEELVFAWPGARLLKTRGLGHNRILRDPATIDAVVAYLKGDEPTSA